MSIFNSLGSNYNPKIAVQSLFAPNSDSAKKDLIDYLENKYGGEVHLFYKGRHALEAAIKISGLSKDKTVAINGFSCFVVYKAVKNAGAKIIYLDIDSNSLNFSVATLKDALKDKSRIDMVVVQNTLGNPAEINEISKICKEKNVLLIEDLAHSVGGKNADFVALSFSQDKIIDSVSGGALIIKNKKYHNVFDLKLSSVSLGQQLKDRFYPLLTYVVRVSYPFGLGKVIHLFLKKLNLLSVPIDKGYDDLKGLPNWYCSLALSYLRNLDKDIKHKKKIVRVYNENIDKSMQLRGHWLIRYPIIVNNRASVIKILKSNGFYVSDIWYDAPVAPRDKLKSTDYRKGMCPTSEKVSEKILNLPTHKNITVKHAKILSGLINKCQN